MHCSTDDEACLASCERVVRLAWPGGYLRERGCPGVKGGAPSDLVMEVGGSPAGCWLLSFERVEGEVLFPELQ